MQDKGGILVRDAELETAFKFLDVSNRGYVTINDLKVCPECEEHVQQFTLQ